MRPARASSASAALVSSGRSTSASVSSTLISSRSTDTSTGDACHSSGTRPVNQPRTRSCASFVIM